MRWAVLVKGDTAGNDDIFIFISLYVICQRYHGYHKKNSALVLEYSPQKFKNVGTNNQK